MQGARQIPDLVAGYQQRLVVARTKAHAAGGAGSKTAHLGSSKVGGGERALKRSATRCLKSLADLWHKVK